MSDSLLLPDGVQQPLVADLIIGRSPDCGLSLPYTSVSREHAAIRAVDERWYVEDLYSRNGTFIDNDRVAPGNRSRLRHGTRLAIAAVVLVVWLTSEVADSDVTSSIELTNGRAMTLSPYQLQVVRCLAAPWLANGSEPASNAAIAEGLGTPAAEDAIKAALRRVYAKVGLAGTPDRVKRRELCRLAREQGWV